MNHLVKIVLIRLLGYSVIGGDAYPDFLDKNQPIGLESIKGYIEENCDYPIEVKIIDLHQEDWHHFLREIMIYKESDVAPKDMFKKLGLADFDVIGLSAPMSSEKTLHFFLSFLTGNPDYKSKVIVVGNLISTFCYEQILEDYPTVFCCVGSGEGCMLSLGNYVFIVKVKNQKREVDVDGFRKDLVSGEAMIPNLFFSYQGVAQKSKKCSWVEERAFSPSVSTQGIVEARGGSMRVQSSRGCDFNCGFCVVNKVFRILGRAEFPVEYVLAYIEKVVANSSLDQIRIDFIDDEFFGCPIDINRMTFLFSGIMEISRHSGKEITFSFAANANSLKFSIDGDSDKVRALWFLAKEAGLRKVFLGLESNVVSQLERYDKYGSPAVNEHAIIFLRDILGVRIEVAMILVDYEMDKNWRKELLENFDFLYKYKLHTERALLIQVVKPLRFSSLFDRYMEKGILLEQTSCYSPIWNARFLNPEVGRFVAISESFSSKKEPLYQLRYRLKQDLLFDLRSEEEKVKKNYKDKLAEIDFFFFRTLLERWQEVDIKEKLEKQLIVARRRVLLEMQKSITDGCIVGYAEYYLNLIDAYLKQQKFLW